MVVERRNHRLRTQDFGLFVFLNYLFLSVLGLRCYVHFFLVGESWGYSLLAVQGLLIAVAFLVAGHRL